MLFPFSFNKSNVRNKLSISCGVNTAVGSSIIKISAPRYNTFKISTRCWIATGKSFTCALGLTGIPYSFPSCSTYLFAFSRSNKPDFLQIGFPRIIFCATVKDGTKVKCWCTIPMLCSMASFELFRWTECPSIKISPSSGWYMPYNTFIKVVFPAPFSPIKPWMLPHSTRMETFWLATTPGKVFVMFFNSTA